MLSINNILKTLSFIFLTAIFFSSCEIEDPAPYTPTLTNAIPEVVFAEEPLTLQANQEGLSKLVWEISDGSIYESSNAEHTFKNSGIYEIKLLGYKGDELSYTKVFKLEVLVKHRTIELDNNFYVLRGTLAPSKSIILEGIYEGETKTSFLEFDQELNLLDTYNNLKDINQPVFNSVLLGNNVFNLIEDNSEVKSTGLKSSEDFVVTDNYYPEEILKYSNGIIHYYQNNNSDFLIDYYNNEYTKLWTKTFSGNGLDINKYIFNNQDVLYYLSFDANEDKINIEKFKNISLSYSTVSYNLGIEAQNREILFAYYKPSNKTIELAVYSNLTKSTRIFSIDENCELNLISEIEGNLNGRPAYTLTDGSLLIKKENKIVKYSNNWSKISELNISNNYFSISRIADNLFLIAENVNNGVRLFYCDKQLNAVTFR